ncbi:hypothetical protein [Bradyrhizobium sp. WSM1253]|uniref:hypothetical protein n=1 Tax=Bradyrhizobium sp. WSM1253 TaxID=319003 RepID=UPI0012F4BF74|nr:hypothetical protein [Bradyrhizobium sp. WSM1253]
MVIHIRVSEGKPDAPCIALSRDLSLRVTRGVVVLHAALLTEQTIARCQQPHVGTALVQVEPAALDGILDAGTELCAASLERVEERSRFYFLGAIPSLAPSASPIRYAARGLPQFPTRRADVPSRQASFARSRSTALAWMISFRDHPAGSTKSILGNFRVATLDGLVQAGV